MRYRIRPQYEEWFMNHWRKVFFLIVIPAWMPMYFLFVHYGIPVWCGLIYFGVSFFSLVGIRIYLWARGWHYKEDAIDGAWFKPNEKVSGGHIGSIFLGVYALVGVVFALYGNWSAVIGMAFEFPLYALVFVGVLFLVERKLKK
jgi:hypothetical protein